MSRERLITRLVTLLAGRAAERVVFGHLNTGAANDLERATAIARKMVCEFGMSDAVGPVRYASQQDEVFLGREISQPRDHSEETARVIDAEIRRIIIEAEQSAEQLMRDNLEILHRCSHALVEREILDAAELDILIAGGELPPAIKNVDELRARLAKERESAVAKPASPAPSMPPDASPGISPA
jgi:cell division protease FtsH